MVETAARPVEVRAMIDSVRHLAQSDIAVSALRRLDRYADWEPWDVAEYHDGGPESMAAAYRAAYLGDRKALIAALREYVQVVKENQA